ncbi:cyclic nucleotide-binding domain-containing protein [Myxococcota bacterium]|nr:cyclic nucleotide-binding domain-containing protein [Myxococcota bacterium]
MDQAIQTISLTELGRILGPDETKKLIQLGEVITLEEGSALFEANDESDSFYIALTGSLQVVLGQKSAEPVVVANLGPGQVVGELEVLTRSLRVASVIATDDCSLLKISASQFDALLEQNDAVANKIMQFIGRTLARRLAAVNQRITTKRKVEEKQVEEEVEFISADDLVEVDDDDLSVLDDLWG